MTNNEKAKDWLSSNLGYKGQGDSPGYTNKMVESLENLLTSCESEIRLKIIAEIANPSEY